MEEITGKIKRILINNQNIEERDGINYLIGTEQAAKEITILMLEEKVKVLEEAIVGCPRYPNEGTLTTAILLQEEINKEIDSLKKL